MNKNYPLGTPYQRFKTRWRFWRRLGYWPNIDQPRTYNEKLQHRKFYWFDDRFTLCSDKYSVREFVKDRIGEKYLVPLIAMAESPDEIDFDAYGNNYVLKLTHDSGGVFICKDGSLKRSRTMRRLKRKFKRNMGINRAEFWYADVKPRIIVESLLQDQNGSIPNDFKFHVFSKGTSQKIILHVDYSRFGDRHRSFYDENCNLLPFGQNKVNKFTELEKPKNLDLMFALSKELAKGFDYVRVDMYNIDGKIYFGELTFGHAGGFGRFTPDKYDLEVGSWWEIDSPYITAQED